MTEPVKKPKPPCPGCGTLPISSSKNRNRRIQCLDLLITYDSLPKEGAFVKANQRYSGFDPSQITHGHCYEWAREVIKHLPGAQMVHVDLWPHRGKDNLPYHVWVKYQGKNYDAEAPQGVSDWRQLPYFRTHSNQTILPKLKVKAMDALGLNRDYKTAGRRAVEQLAKHAELMKKYEAEGFSREEASRKALAEMEKKLAKDTDSRSGVTACQACRAPLNGDDVLEVGGRVVCPDCADLYQRSKAKDSLNGWVRGRYNEWLYYADGELAATVVHEKNTWYGSAGGSTKRKFLSEEEAKRYAEQMAPANLRRIQGLHGAKDGLIFSALKGAAVLMALLYLSRIPQQPVEYDLTKYVPPQRAWDEGYDPSKLTAMLRQGDTLVPNQDVSAKRSSGRATTWKAGKKFWVVSSIVDPVRKQGMLRVAPVGMGMGDAVAFTDQQIQSYFR